MEKKIEVKDVMSVYSGKEGCACGCNGKYFTAKAHQAVASKDRGYEVTDDEISDSMIKKVTNLMNNTPDNQVEKNSDWFSMMVGQRVYTLYFVPKVKVS